MVIDQASAVRGNMISTSYLTLGTVQLGLEYGLDKTKPDSSQAREMLDLAYENGITAFDTASAYGDSEEVLGQWIDASRPQNAFIVTKVHNLDHSSAKALRVSMEEKIRQSITRLRLDNVPLVMLHHCDEYLEHPDWVDEAFCAMREQGLITFSGVSVYSSHDYRRLAESNFDALQIPLNIVDWKHIDDGSVEVLHQAGKFLFARSVFLQGLLLRTPETLPERLSFAKSVVEKVQKLTDQFGLSSAQLCIAFAKALPFVDSLVLGARNQHQVISNVNLVAETKALGSDQMEQVHLLLADTPSKISNPAEWS